MPPDDRVWDVPEPGRGRLLLVVGPRGSGRTTELGHMAEGLRRAGWTVCETRAAPATRDHGLEVVRGLLEDLPDLDLPDPFVGGGIPTRDRFLESLVRPGGTALVIDDVEHCDDESLDLLVHVAARVATSPVAVVVGGRACTPRRFDRRTGALVDLPTAEVRRLPPLDAQEVADLLAARLGATPTPDLVAAVLAATGGIHAQVAALAGVLRAECVDPTDPHSAIDGVGDPRFGNQLRRSALANDPDRVAVIDGLAVLGAPATVGMLASLTGTTWDVTAAAVDVAVDAGLAETVVHSRSPADVRVAMAHPFVAASLRAGMALTRRAELHRRAVHSLHRDGADEEQIARHLECVAPTGDPFVAEQLAAAARSALTRGDPLRAAVLFRRATAEPPADGSLADLHAELGRALTLADRPSEALDAYRAAARATEDPERRAAISRLVAMTLLRDPTRGGEAVATLDEAARALAADSPTGPLLEADIGTADLISLSARRAASGRTPRFADPECLQLLAVEAMRSVLYTGPADESAALARRALSGGRLLEAEGPESSTYWLGAAALIYSLDLVAALDECDRAHADALARGSDWGLALASCFRSRARFLVGDLAGAEEDGRIFCDLAPHTLALGPAFLVDALVAQGRLDEAEDALRNRSAGSLNASMYHFLVRSEGILRIRRGDLSGGVDRLFELALGYRDWGTSTPGPIQWRPDAAEALAAMGRPDKARRLMVEEIESCRRFGSPICLGVALRTAGNLADAAEGVAHLAEAVDLLERTPARLELARACIDLGRAHRLERRSTVARAHLHRGLEHARTCGAIALVECAYAELEASGVRPRKILQGGIGSLTPSERRVAGLAETGLSNRAIAEELFVTVRTVESHLASCYRKLGIRSRSELTGALGDEMLEADAS